MRDLLFAIVRDLAMFGAPRWRLPGEDRGLCL
jgi:hypothetical protein